MAEAAQTAVETKGVVWDLTSYFPSFDGPEMLAFKAQLREDIASLVAGARQAGPLTEASLETWENLILRAEELMSRMGHVHSYVDNLASATRPTRPMPWRTPRCRSSARRRRSSTLPCSKR